MAPPLTLLDLDFSKDLAFNVSAFDGFDQSHKDAFNVSAFAEQANTLLLETSIGTARDGGGRRQKYFQKKISKNHFQNLKLINIYDT